MVLAARAAIMMSRSAQRVWVVGAGFLGSELVRLCRAAGVQTLSIDRRTMADVQGEAQRADTLQRALQKCPPQVVYSCTATHGGDAEAYRSSYAEVAEQLVRSAPGARVVFCSTCSVYERRDGGEVSEMSACPGTEEKMRAVLCAEQSVLRAGGVVARLAALYGPDRCEIVRRYVLDFGRELPGGRARWVNYVHVADAAHALMLLAVRGEAGQVYNVCGESHRLGDLYTCLDTLCGGREMGSGSPPPQPEGRGRANMRVKADKIRLLGWEAREDLMSFARRFIDESGKMHCDA